MFPFLHRALALGNFSADGFYRLFFKQMQILILISAIIFFSFICGGKKEEKKEGKGKQIVINF